MKTSLLSNVKFFTALLSIFAMLNLSVGTVYAQAQESSEQPNLSEQRIQESQNNNAAADVSKQNMDKLTRTQEVNLEKTSQGMSDMIYFLVLIAMSLFMMSLWRYSPMSTDMKIAMGAASVMLGAELVTIFNTRKKIDATSFKVETREDGTVNNLQLDALKKQKESYEELKKYAALKWKIQAAGAAAYTVAATLAYIQASKISASGKACLAGLKLNKCPVGIGIHAKGQVNFWTPMDSKTKGALKTENFSALNASFAACIGYAGVDAAAASSAAAAACSDFVYESMTVEPVTESVPLQVTSIDRYFENFLPNKPVLKISSVDKQDNLLIGDSIKNYDFHFLSNHKIPYKSEVNFFAKLSSADFLGRNYEPSKQHDLKNINLPYNLLDLFLPSAKAFEINKLGLGAAVVIILYALIKGSYKWMDVLVMNPAHRANLYLATAAAAGVTALLTKKAQGQAENNIKKIDEMIQRLERLQNMKTANLDQKMASTALGGQLLPQDYEDVSLTGNGSKTACPPRVGASASSKGNCASFEQEIKSSPDISSLGSVMGNMASLSGRVADGFSGTSTLSAGTLADIDNLSSQNAIANRALRQAQEKFNEYRVASGEPKIDFEKQKNDLLKAVGASVQSELRKAGQSPSQAVAGMGSDFVPEDPNSKTAQEESTELVTTSVAAKGGANMDNVAAPVFDFTFEDEEFEEVPLEEEFAYSDEMYAKAFESQANSSDGGTSQIVGNRDVSLFKVISVRYMKSGLPRLLDELQELE